MRFKKGDKVEFIYRNKKSAGEINGVYPGTQEVSIKQSDSPIDLLFSDKAVAKVEEPERIVVPQFVADWFEANKDNLGLEIWMYIYNFDKHKNECDSFCMFMNDKSGKQLETLISMQYGYYVQKEVSK
ncbi:DUF1642 domain-containing protein [Listeria innocua]|nr:DUF1642 domain-containing protein [Listeria innocua]EIP2463527.1 DUF1642 domain-containing protein [Listeria innocua]EIP2466453.1 DUF1642 domain-containing protein [Listeria innocua]EIP2469392.1 DUF1642 domain-containing protein [Listeria innocua]EIP2472331.1 DUF1642 domain-containing protein [Listeria innocua]